MDKLLRNIAPTDLSLNSEIFDAGSASSRAAAVALSALNHIDHAVAVIDPAKNLLYRNARFEALFGADWLTELQAYIVSPRSWYGRGGPHECFIHGRTISVQTLPIPDGLLITADDISQKVIEETKAAELARTDPLTRLGNGLMFCEHVTRLLRSFEHEPGVAAMLTINLDRFKAINDSLGHPVGDNLLRLVADRLRTTLKSEDIAARFGSDEFGILQVSQPQPHSAAVLAKRLVDLLGRSYIFDGHLLNISVSVGIAFLPTDGSSESELRKNADLALYRAKSEGGRNYRFFEPAMDQQVQARRSLEVDLRRTLALRELVLVYQPQINLVSNEITGFEALLRWNHPKRGVVPPAEFIPLAEEIGLIVQIGEWVLRTACHEAAKWLQPLRVAVNVSAAQFGSPSLVPTVLSALAESGLDPRRLELEITESVLLGDPSALDVLHKLRGMGIHVSMDDFGTGYSSLSYLRSFPFDKIKIDQSFVRSDPQDPSGLEIIRAIAALGHSLGMATIAEGVETEEQLAHVTACGCTDVQGYLISKPIPPEALAEFLQSHAEKMATATTAQSAPEEN